jgi:hypothetical protein
MNFINIKCEDGTCYIIPYENLDIIISRPGGKYYSVWLNKNSALSAIEQVIEVEHD